MVVNGKCDSRDRSFLQQRCLSMVADSSPSYRKVTSWRQSVLQDSFSLETKELACFNNWWLTCFFHHFFLPHSEAWTVIPWPPMQPWWLQVIRTSHQGKVEGKRKKRPMQMQNWVKIENFPELPKQECDITVQYLTTGWSTPGIEHAVWCMLTTWNRWEWTIRQE